jgi:hypothetical protein
MKKEHKIALMRVISDIIKADKVINKFELEFLNSLFDKYKICREDVNLSLNIPFSYAVQNLSELPYNEALRIIDDVSRLMMMDGESSREENLLLMSLKMCLLPGHYLKKARMITSKKMEITVENFQLLFIEDGYSKAINEILQNNHRQLWTEAALSGFDFVYIPSITKRIQATNHTLFDSVITFIAPTISDDETSIIIDQLNQMTTDYFRKHILCNEFEMDLKNTKPSFLVKVSDSVCSNTVYSDYLIFEVTENILKEFLFFIDEFNKPLLIRNNQIRTPINDGDNFLFYGFYKTFFNLLTLRKGTRSGLIIDPRNRTNNVFLKDICDIKLKLGLREKAFYALCVFESQFGGLNFKKATCKSEFKATNERLNNIQIKYNIVYEMFGGAKGEAPDIILDSNRNPIVSRIRSAIRSNHTLKNQNEYLPLFNGEGNLIVELSNELVFVVESKKHTPVLMKNSVEWKKLLN